MQNRIVIVGAAGRDFHNFNVCYRDDAWSKVVAFTATQIPDIAGRKYPAELAGTKYPEGIPIYPEEQLEKVIKEEKANLVVFSYSDVSHVRVMNLASRALAAGADFLLLSAEKTMLKSKVPVVSICATRTGCGKSPVSRRVAELLKEQGMKLVAIRHPMPYGDLVKQKVQRFATAADMDSQRCTIEEREEYEPHVRTGTVVYAGADYGAILREAEKEADVIIWDGGNNDTPFLKPDLEIVVTDPHRAGHEVLYHPGEVNLLRANVVVINKVDSAFREAVETVRRNVKHRNSKAVIIETDSAVKVEQAERLRGARVLVIEDGPSLTHGEMAFGAGVIAAQRAGATLVDPRQYAVGSIRETFGKYEHVGALLPAMGYSEKQLAELQETIQRTPCDFVLIATPIDLRHLIPITQPSLRVTYEIGERGPSKLAEIIREFVNQHIAVTMS
ncbi:MAG TPA: cyclic 2,3-diphosphoglycerate synthase [Candidatus Limnocylindrales bacterium]|nr:cyclic 2,3-diphosphoglycerate synthase [Candidatus Limnocylindrales bacterium]